ncbi:MAG: acyl carrier protein [Mycobacterium sp.]|jgi:acyl carrier protein|nr:acyl carrier protein [Mycobacterium sp.]MBV8291335.1 acyl carrier protein [Mycobacterium sp.]
MLFAPQESEILAEVTHEIIDLVRIEATELDVTADSVLSDVGLDSLKFMSVVFKIEARFDIELQEEDADDLRTVGDLATLVAGRIGEQS